MSTWAPEPMKPEASPEATTKKPKLSYEKAGFFEQDGNAGGDRRQAGRGGDPKGDKSRERSRGLSPQALSRAGT